MWVIILNDNIIKNNFKYKKMLLPITYKYFGLLCYIRKQPLIYYEYIY